MPISRGAGYPQFSYTGTGGNNNIPILFSGKTLQKFYASTVLSEISNTDYVGEITKQGDKVIIRTVPNITIRDYSKGQKLDLERPESPSIEVNVDYAKYFNCGLDDIDIKQMDIPMLDKWAEDAAEQMKITIETHVLGAIYTQCSPYNTGANAGKKSGNINLGTTPTTPIQVSKTNIIDTLVSCNQVLDEQDIPQTDRWIIIPAWMATLIKTSDLKDASLSGDGKSLLRTGEIGSIDRFRIFSSNLLPSYTTGAISSGNPQYIVFGHKSALAFVSQLTKVETYRPQDTFADAIKGLNVYGFKVIQPTALGTLVAYK